MDNLQLAQFCRKKSWWDIYYNILVLFSTNFRRTIKIKNFCYPFCAQNCSPSIWDTRILLIFFSLCFSTVKNDIKPFIGKKSDSQRERNKRKQRKTQASSRFLNADWQAERRTTLKRLFVFSFSNLKNDMWNCATFSIFTWMKTILFRTSSRIWTNYYKSYFYLARLYFSEF